MNKTLVSQAYKLYVRLDELLGQRAKVAAHTGPNALITLHLSVATHISDVPVEMVQSYLDIEITKTQNQLLELGCEL
jgi:hypothetical protein